MEYRSIPTTLGRAKLEQAALLGVPLQLTVVEFGDGGGAEYEPTGLELALRGKVYEAMPNMLFNSVEAETWVELHAVMPFDVGGWWLREYGVRDAAGDLIFIGNLPSSFKPVGSSGAVKDIAFELLFDIQNADSVTLKIDPSKVLATRKFVEDWVAQELAKLDHKQSVRYATTGAVALAGLAVQAGGDWPGALTAGDRVLVKNQPAGKDNGIYAAAAGAWLRVADADGSVEVTSGLVVAVEHGATLADTRWQLVTDGPIVLGATALVFQDVTKGYAPLASPAFTGGPTAPTPALFDADNSLATTEYVRRALGNYRTASSLLTGAVISAANIGGIYQPAEGGTVLFPPPSSLGLPLGSSVTLMMQGRAAATILVTGGATLATDVNGDSSVSLVRGQVVTVSAHSETEWVVLNHSKYDASFSSTLTANGSQKLPGGFLMKWATYTGLAANNTTVKTRPSAFPNGLLCESITPVGGSAANVGANGSNATQVAIRCEALVPTSVFVISIGC